MRAEISWKYQKKCYKKLISAKISKIALSDSNRGNREAEKKVQACLSSLLKMVPILLNEECDRYLTPAIFFRNPYIWKEDPLKSVEIVRSLTYLKTPHALSPPRGSTALTRFCRRRPPYVQISAWRPFNAHIRVIVGENWTIVSSWKITTSFSPRGCTFFFQFQSISS